MITLSLPLGSLALDLERKRLILRDGDQRIELSQTAVAQMMAFLVAHPAFFEDLPIEASKRPTPVVPRFMDLLEDGTLQPGLSTMMLGVYGESGEPCLLSWPDFRSGAVGGCGRSGKSNTLFFLALQAILSGADVWVADFHATKSTSLIAFLEPLASYVRLARNSDEIAQMIEDLSREMERRKAQAGPYRPLVIIFDEWNSLLENYNSEAKHMHARESYSAVAASTVLMLEREMGGYDMHSLLGVYDWSEKALGSASLRHLLHSVLCHRMPASSSKYVLPGKLSSQTEVLRTGHLIYKNHEGTYHSLIVPFVSVEDAAIVAQLLAEHHK